MQKKLICFALSLIFILSCASTFIVDAQDKIVYVSQFSKSQNYDGCWYFCEFKGDENFELGYIRKETNGSVWEGWQSKTAEYPSWNNLNGCVVPAKVGEAGLKFVSPRRGKIKIKFDAEMPDRRSLNGNGVLLSVYKGSRELYSNNLTYDNPLKDVSVTDSLRCGEELYFKISAKDNNAFDWTRWWPTVEFLDEDYVADKNEGLYFSKNGNTEQKLAYDTSANAYVSADKTAYMNYSSITVSKSTSLIRKWNIDEEGRYRFSGYITPNKDENMLLEFYKNGEKIKTQYIKGGEENKFDFRMYLNKSDSVDVCYLTSGCATASAVHRIDFTEFLGTLPFCDTTSSTGYNLQSEDEILLSDLIENGEQKNFHSIRYDVPKNMNYDGENAMWTSTYDDDKGYIRKNSVYPGMYSDTYMEFDVPKSGKLHITGDMAANHIGDGVVSKIYINDEMIWSSRVGGERPVRWDEPYDVSYFINEINVFADVKFGDKIKFSFNQWRKCENDEVDISNVKLTYVKGNVLSDTTKFKRDNSILLNSDTDEVYWYGAHKDVDIASAGGEFLTNRDGVKEIFGNDFDFTTVTALTVNGKEYFDFKDICKIEELEFLNIDDSTAVIWDGLSTEFGYAEISELSIAKSEGGLYAPLTEYPGDIRFDFEKDSEGFVNNGEAKIAGVTDGALKVIATNNDPNISISGLNISLEQYRYVRVRLKDTTRNTSMNIFLKKDANYYQTDMKTDALPDSDYVEYVFDLHSGKTIKGTLQESYDTLRFDFMNNMWNDSDGAVSYIDYIIVSKNPTENTNAVINSVSVNGHNVAGFEPERELSKTEIGPLEYLNLKPQNITVSISEDFKDSSTNVKIVEYDQVKYIDISVGDTYGNFKDYRIVCNKKEENSSEISNVLYNSETNVLSVNCSLYIPNGKDCFVVLAIKDNDGKIKGIVSENKSVDGYLNFDLKINGYSRKTGDIAVLYVWNNSYGIKPLMAEYTHEMIL